MPEQKTKPTGSSVKDFLATVADEQVRKDCAALVKMMTKVTGSKPKMWGPSIVGFGQYHYRYESGHEGDACLAGFSPRKSNITVYAMADATGEKLLSKLGKHKATTGCIYIRKLADIDMEVLEKIVKGSVDRLQKLYPPE